MTGLRRSVLAAAALLLAGCSTLDGHGACGKTPGRHTFARTELFFGLSRPDGSMVDKDEFQDFIDREVTPRFPDGLTVLTGDGQFEDSRSRIIREPGRLLILLYEQVESADADIEAIRSAYKNRFRQESVLRADTGVCASF